jgi:hypothetical protein
MTDSERERRIYLGLWITIAVVLSVPVWLTSIPPLSDLHNHLTRLHIVQHYGDIASYRARYDLNWGPHPNLALDLVGWPLIRVFGLTLTAKIFLTLTILVWHYGCHRLGRAIYGRNTWRALICSFFVYNQQFLLGYVNFAFGIGLFLIVLALWLEHRDQWTAVWLTLCTLLGLATFLAHLSAFASLAVAVAAMTVARFVATKKITRDLVLGVIPLLPGTVIFFYGFLSKTGKGSEIQFGGIGQNLREGLTLLTGYHRLFDYACAAIVVALAAFVLLRRTSLRLHREVLVAGLALGVAYWACPTEVAGGIEVNFRFAIGAFTLVAFALDVSLSAWTRKAVFVAAMALFTLRIGVITSNWLRLDRKLGEQTTAWNSIDKGSRVYNIFFYPKEVPSNSERVEALALLHAICMAAIDREAYLPTLYGFPSQQPIVHHEVPPYTWHRFGIKNSPPIRWDEIFGHYDYVWTCNPIPDQIAPLKERAKLTSEGGGCQLYRLSE